MTSRDDWAEVPVFGDRDAPDAVVRPSAYGLTSDAEGRIATVRTSQGLFLPGGGIDPGESPSETVVREFWEECGLEVTAGGWTARAIDFVTSLNDRVVFEKLSTFVDATCTERRGTSQEPDHELEWVTADVAAATLRDPSHRWAVEQWSQRGAARSTRVERHVKAPASVVYRLLVDPAAVARWRVPEGMRAIVHTFDAREGGDIRISLTYDATDAVGKTVANTDTYRGRFVRLVPDREVVEAQWFETDDPALKGEMRSIITIAESPDGGSDVCGVHENVPAGVSLEDNETGWRMAFEKLAALAEGR